MVRSNLLKKLQWQLILISIGFGFGVGFSMVLVSDGNRAFNNGFQVAIIFGFVVATIINYFIAQMKGNIGWRISLGLDCVSALIGSEKEFFFSSREVFRCLSLRSLLES
uniref:Major facilitator superfamily (MFS) profile domain-containing protein n=1 Tax=Brassica campestris TaxID=3711 RepID=A0A3P6A4E5_BRACM|nr:unnamed protein product [Brassica rapa]